MVNVRIGLNLFGTAPHALIITLYIFERMISFCTIADNLSNNGRLGKGQRVEYTIINNICQLQIGNGYAVS